MLHGIETIGHSVGPQQSTGGVVRRLARAIAGSSSWASICGQPVWVMRKSIRSSDRKQGVPTIRLSHAIRSRASYGRLKDRRADWPPDHPRWRRFIRDGEVPITVIRRDHQPDGDPSINLDAARQATLEVVAQLRSNSELSRETLDEVRHAGSAQEMLDDELRHLAVGHEYLDERRNIPDGVSNPKLAKS